MSADDFRDLVTEFDHDTVTELEFYRWTPPDFHYGDVVPGTGGYSQITIGGSYAFVPSPPSEYIDQLSEGDRERGPVLIWQWSELDDGTPTDSLRTIRQSDHGRADRVYDVDRDRWYDVATEYDFRRQAKVSGVVALLIDGVPTDILPPPEDP